MGLHEALTAGDVKWIWKWYEAVVRRAGRAHLLQVPVVKRLHINTPNWYYTENERRGYMQRETERGETWSWPGYVYSSAEIKRACNQTQEVDYWQNRPWAEEDWWDWNEETRGVCKPCLRFARTLLPDKIKAPSASYIREMGGIGRADQSVQGYIEEAHGRPETGTNSEGSEL